jgi:hypothetical protein
VTRKKARVEIYDAVPLSARTLAEQEAGRRSIRRACNEEYISQNTHRLRVYHNYGGEVFVVPIGSLVELHEPEGDFPSDFMVAQIMMVLG